jgi:hypothetical protein
MGSVIVFELVSAIETVKDSSQFNWFYLAEHYNIPNEIRYVIDYFLLLYFFSVS